LSETKYPTLRYTVDSRDRITWIDGPWDEFAAANGGRNLLAGDVIGRPLTDFLSGAETKHIYRSMHAYVRESGKKIAFDYRCDGGRRRREMRMEIEADGETIRYSSQILRETEISPPAAIDYTAKSGVFVMMCSWCKSFEFPVRSGCWRSLELIYSFVSDSFQLTHGICPACRDKFVFSKRHPEK